MSFKIQNFCWVGGKHGCQIFAYKTEDSIEEITSDNYFKNIQGKIFINDVIIIIQNSGLKYIKVAEYSYREGLQIKTEIISSGGEVSDIDIPSFSDSIPLKSIENGSSGISNEMSRSDHQHPLIQATTDEKGSVELATEEEAIESLDNEKAITPLTNQKHFEEQQATNENISNGDDVKKYINPKQLKEVLEQKQNKLTNIDNTLNIVDNLDNTSNINLAISNTDNILLKEVDGLKVNINLSYDNITGILKLTGKDNTEIATIDLPLSSFLKSSRVEKDPINPDNAGEILNGTYLILTFSNEDNEEIENYIDLSKLVDIYTSTNKAISIEDYEITLNVDNASNLIINDNGLSVADTHIIISKQEKEKYDNYETNKQNKLTAGDLIEINEANDTIKVINVYNKTETDGLLNSKQNKLTAGNNINIEEKTDEGTGEVLETIINSYSILQVEELPVDNINNKVIYKLAIKNDGGNIIGYDLYYYDEINGFVKITKDKEIIKKIEKTLNIIDNTYKIKTDLKNSDNTIIASNELDISENIVNSSTELSSFTNKENSDKKFITEGYLNKVMTNIPEPINDKDVVNKKYVDIKTTNKGFKFKGYISTEEPTNPNELDLWYDSLELPTIFPILVKKYENGAWGIDTIEYTPSIMDLWIDTNTGNDYYWLDNEFNIINFKISTDNETIELTNTKKIKVKSIIKEVETLPDVEQEQNIIYYNKNDGNYYIYGGTYTETNSETKKIKWLLINNQLQKLQAGEGIKIKNINNELVISSTGVENYAYRGIFNDINSARYLLADTLADKDIILLITDNQYYQYNATDDIFSIVNNADIINNIQNKQDTIQDSDDTKIENNVSNLTDENGNNITDINGNVIKQVKKNILVKNPEFLGIYKDNSSLSINNNCKDGDIIYNNKTKTYQSFNKVNNTWENYNDLRILQSIKSFQTSIGLPGNSPLQLSRRLKQGSTVELEDVLTSNFTRFRWDMDYTTYDNIVNLPQTRKYNGDIFRLKDNSVVMYVCEDFVDENYNVMKGEDYVYIIDNRRVNLSPATLIKPYSSNWSVAFNSLGMWLKNDVVELNGYISITGNPSVSTGYNAMFTIDTTKIKTGYIIDTSNFISGSSSINRNDWLLVFTNSKYYSTVLRTKTTDKTGVIEVQIYCSNEISTSLNNYGGGLSICGYFLNLIKKS